MAPILSTVCYLMQIKFRFLKWRKKISQLHVPYRKDLLIHTCWVKQLIPPGTRDSEGMCVMHGEICVNCPQCLTAKCCFCIQIGLKVFLYHWSSLFLFINLYVFMFYILLNLQPHKQYSFILTYLYTILKRISDFIIPDRICYL